MAAYLIVHFNIEDSKLHDEYSSEAILTMRVGEDCQLLAYLLCAPRSLSDQS